MSASSANYLPTLSISATEEISQTLGHNAFIVIVIGADGVQKQLLPADVNIEPSPVDNKIPLDFINISINPSPSIEYGKTGLEGVMSQYALCNIGGKWRPC